MIRVRVGTDNMSADDIVVGFKFDPGALYKLRCDYLCDVQPGIADWSQCLRAGDIVLVVGIKVEHYEDHLPGTRVVILTILAKEGVRLLSFLLMAGSPVNEWASFESFVYDVHEHFEKLT